MTATTTLYPFSDLRFGYASAEVESEEDPELLVEGYCDPHNFVERALRGRHCVFLGYKGSGKSALAEHLRLTALANPNLFATVSYLSDFPYTDFKKVVSGSGELEAKLPTAWQWLLLVALFASLRGDQGGRFEQDANLNGIVTFLRGSGLLPVDSLKQLTLISSKKSFKAKIPGFLESNFEYAHSGQDIQVFQALELLRRVVHSFRSRSRHLLIIDGLDDILSLRDIQYQSLAALLLAVQRLNTDFKKHGVRAKILVLCRTDLFERLPGANKNKLRQDLAVNFDWYHNPRDPGESALTTLAGIRAQLQSKQETSVFEYFPAKIDSRWAPNFLFDLTRHTPRDFLQLLVSIQHFARGDGKITRAQILSGTRRYSIEYFLPEIKDELVGYILPGQIDALLVAIGAIKSRHFYYRDVVKAAEEYTDLKPDALAEGLRALFECSAIGNIWNRSTGSAFYSFRYRNRNLALNPKEQIMLHRGVWKALNLT